MGNKIKLFNTIILTIIFVLNTNTIKSEITIDSLNIVYPPHFIDISPNDLYLIKSKLLKAKEILENIRGNKHYQIMEKKMCASQKVMNEILHIGCAIPLTVVPLAVTLVTLVLMLEKEDVEFLFAAYWPVIVPVEMLITYIILKIISSEISNKYCTQVDFQINESEIDGIVKKINHAINKIDEYENEELQKQEIKTESTA